MGVETVDDAIRIAGVSYAALQGPLPVGGRTSDDVRRPTPVPSPESNDNPVLQMEGHPGITDFVRDGDFNSRPSRRGYLTMFLNPAQFWQMDYFSSGKLVYDPGATSMLYGMAPDSPQRANIAQRTPTSYGDLVTLTTDAAGIEPYAGW